MAHPLGDDELYELSRANRDLRIERTPDGELIIMSPTGGETGRQNATLLRLLGNWSERDGSGIVFDSSTGFLLPNGAERSPDAAWVGRERWDALSDDERRTFPPLCPDFVIELQSPSDSGAEQRAKMLEYIGCGAALGWLLDPDARQVLVYRPGAAVETLEDPAEVSADPILAGFVLRLAALW
jgi:Uma2 family endonuclease